MSAFGMKREIEPHDIYSAVDRMNRKGAKVTRGATDELVEELFNPEYQVKKVRLDGKPELKFRCPDCQVWGFIDDDQYQGRVSIQCECGFHKTLNLSEVGAIMSSAKADA